jgi:Domain of unknown function (DUF4136)
MRRTLSTLLKNAALPLILLSVSCAGYNIRYDYDRAAPYSRYQSFDFVRPKGGANKDDKTGTSLMDRRVQQAMERELATKNLKREATADPDVLVACYPVFRERHYQTRTAVGFGHPWGWGWGWGTHTVYTQNHSYREGSIVVSIRDFKTDQLIWEGAAEGALSGLDGAHPEDVEEKVTRALHDLMREFPPTKK